MLQGGRAFLAQVMMKSESKPSPLTSRLPLMLDSLLLVQRPAAVYLPAPAAGDPPNILLAGSKVVGFPSDDEAAALVSLGARVLDAQGLICCPGFIDVGGLCFFRDHRLALPTNNNFNAWLQMHEHLAGGGGEAGPASRNPRGPPERDPRRRHHHRRGAPGNRCGVAVSGGLDRQVPGPRGRWPHRPALVRQLRPPAGDRDGQRAPGAVHR